MDFNEQVLWLQHIPNSLCLLPQYYSNPRSLLVEMHELFHSPVTASVTFYSSAFLLLLEEIEASQLSFHSLTPTVLPASDYKI